MAGCADFGQHKKSRPRAAFLIAALGWMGLFRATPPGAALGHFLTASTALPAASLAAAAASLAAPTASLAASLATTAAAVAPDAAVAAIEAAPAAAEAAMSAMAGAGAGAGAAAGAGAGAGAASGFLPQAARATAATKDAKTSDLFMRVLEGFVGQQVIFSRHLLLWALSAIAQRPIAGRQEGLADCRASGFDCAAI